MNGSFDFYLDWDNYKEGFGDLTHEFWIGNDKLHYFTSQSRYELRVDLVNRDGAPYYAKFDNFRINDESDNYRLVELGTYSGDAGWYTFFTFEIIILNESLKSKLNL